MLEQFYDDKIVTEKALYLSTNNNIHKAKVAVRYWQYKRSGGLEVDIDIQSWCEQYGLL